MPIICNVAEETRARRRVINILFRPHLHVWDLSSSPRTGEDDRSNGNRVVTVTLVVRTPQRDAQVVHATTEHRTFEISDGKKCSVREQKNTFFFTLLAFSNIRYLNGFVRPSVR